MSNKEKAALFCNIVLILLTVIGSYMAYASFGAGMIRFYTVDSNLLCLISSVLYVVFLLMKKSQQEIPFAVAVLRFVASICLVITFTVTVAYLAPVRIMVPDGSFLENLFILLTQASMLYQHLLYPVISFISFCFFEGDRRLNKKKTIWYAVLTTFTYGIILIILNILHKVDGPYPFLKVTENPPVYIVIIIIILIVNYFVARAMLVLNQKNALRRKRT